MKKEIVTESAPRAAGPYSQALAAGNYIFVSGQLPVTPQTGVIPEDIAAQTVLTLENLKAVLKAAGADMPDVVKTTIFLTDLNNFSTVNEIYGKYFSPPYPARSTVGVSTLPKGVLIEIDAVAAGPDRIVNLKDALINL